MDGYVKFLITVVLVIGLGLTCTALLRLRAKRTIRNWFGSGVNCDLAPHEAALLRGMHPSAIVTIRAVVRGEEEGELKSEEVFRLLEEIYESVNEKMIPYSGRATSVYYRDLVAGLWDRLLRGGIGDDVSPWFLLHDCAGREWDRIGDGPGEDRLKELLRRVQLSRNSLVPERDYAARARAAQSGFFRYRKDLVKPARQEAGWHPYIPR